MGIDDLRAKFKPRRERARVLFDQSLIAEHAAADEALNEALLEHDASSSDTTKLDAARALVDELAARIVAEEDELVFESVGRHRWLDLVKAHPPTKSQKAEGYDFNPDSFPPAAVTLSCVSHELDLAEAEWLAAELDLAEWQRIWGACLVANLGVAARPVSMTSTVLSRAFETTTLDAAAQE